MARTGSGHRPLLMKNLNVNLNCIKYFRFLNCWLKLPGFYDVVKERWNLEVSDNPVWILQSKLKALSRKLTKWSREDIGDINEAVNNWKAKLQYLEDRDIEDNTEESREEINRAHAEYIRWLSIQDSLLKQKCRIKWFEDGDKNSMYFHCTLREKRQKQQDNEFLCRMPDDEEIKNAVLTLSANSTTGPDGYNGAFFHNCWDIIRKEASAFVLEVFKGKVSPNQSGFVKDIIIYENSLLAQKIIHNILTEIREWVDIVQNLISNVWYSIIINGSRHGFFSSSQGLKQDDPLSPSLFIIAAEVLSRSLKNLHNHPDFTPFAMHDKVPKVNHLAYADDIVIFCSVTSKSIKLVMKQIGNYEDRSGQLVNRDKTVFLTAPKTSANIINRIRQCSGFMDKNFPLNYLGCPLYVGRKRTEYFDILLSKIVKRLNGWKDKLLSYGGKIVLIKGVLQSLPINTLSTMSPPKATFKLIEKYFANFLLG
ncbi:uncharacterized protein [Nicotiana sylvestris]|uniref:uncharacterized protein n=1 Tax=Nicotiana sylvestris TaxID=4096 RepID=UPI00388CBF40